MQKDEQFSINGLGDKKILSGSIRVNGAKNAALKAMASALLFKDAVLLKNVPNIEDVHRMQDLLEHMGISASRNKNSLRIDVSKMKTSMMCPDISKRLRASIVLTGPVLTRTGKVVFPYPGGCEIGLRPIDLFLEGFQKMGARGIEKEEQYTLKAPKGGLVGADLFLRKQSVCATETFMMAAVLARGKTTIRNAAMEPEIKHLADFLNSCGAKIEGAGTTTVIINGTKLLSAKNKTYNTVPDRIEAGSFLILGALCAKKLTITHCEPEHLESLIEFLTQAGVKIKTDKNSMTVQGGNQPNSKFQSIDITTHEYPGFPTDLQAPMTVFLTQATGEAIVFETIFENRLGYTESLMRMGAKIKMMDSHRIIVKGPAKLRGREMMSPDLRAGLAYIIAATVAKGKSIIHNVYNIDRGYENIEERFRQIGVDINRIKQ